MRILIKIAILLAVVAALIYGGLRGYIWHSVKSGVDDAILQMEPFAAVSYQSIYVSTDLDGTVGIDGLLIKPKMTSDEIRIQSIRVAFPGLLALLAARSDFAQRELPEQMRLTVSGFSIDLNGQLLATLNKMQRQTDAAPSATERPSLRNFDTLGCGKVTGIGIEELTRMGYQLLELDSDLSYDYQRLRNTLTLTLLLRSKGMYAIEVKAEMQTDPNSLARGTAGVPKISELKVDYVDGGYTVLRNRFCAAQIDSTEEDFKGRHLEALSQALGATFPSEAVESYQRFLAGGTRISATLTPKPGIDLATLDTIPVQDAIELLGLELAIDNKKIDLASFEWGKSYTRPLPSSSVETTKRESQAVLLPGPKPQLPAQFRTTPPSKLGNHIGSQVKIVTRSGLRRDGIIESVDGSSVTVRLTAQRGKGFISFPIAFSEIASAKVLY